MKRPAPPPLPSLPITEDSGSVSTPDRLVEAAGEIFAEHGFQNATVREICQRAEANIAAVNYHFGDKRGLYHAVFLYAHSCAGSDEVAGHLQASQPRAKDTSSVSKAAPAARLRLYIHALLGRILDEGRPAWHAKLMAREMVEPTGVLDDLIERSIRPHFDALQRLIRELIGPRAPDETIRLCAISIVGQCVFYRHSRPIIARLYPDLRFTAEQVRKTAEHIADFSLEGLSHYVGTRSATRARAPSAAMSSARSGSAASGAAASGVHVRGVPRVQMKRARKAG